MDIFFFFFQYCRKKGLYSPESRRDFFQRLWNIFGKPAVREIIFELMEYKASTVRVLCVKLNLSKSSVYYALDLLESEGLVVHARPLSTGGRPATIYAIHDYTPDDIARAVTLDLKSRNPGYTEGLRIYQLILDDWLSKPEPRPPLYTLDDIYPIIRRESQGYRWMDLEPLVMANLRRAQVTIHIGGIS